MYLPREITSEVHRQDLRCVDGRDCLERTPGNAAQDLPNELDWKCFAKERNKDLTSGQSTTDLKCRTHKSDHENRSSGHDLLVTIPANEVSGKLQTNDFTNIGAVRHWQYERGQTNMIDDVPAACQGAVMEGTPSTT
jgi:hypothetical protein